MRLWLGERSGLVLPEPTEQQGCCGCQAGQTEIQVLVALEGSHILLTQSKPSPRVCQGLILALLRRCDKSQRVRQSESARVGAGGVCGPASAAAAW